MKIKITIEIETDSAPSPDPVEKANEQGDLREWINEPTQRTPFGEWINEPTIGMIPPQKGEDLPWTDLDQAIVEAATVGELLKIQEAVNAQLGQPKANYSDGRKIHCCGHCGAPHRKSQARLNGHCLDCAPHHGPYGNGGV